MESDEEKNQAGINRHLSELGKSLAGDWEPIDRKTPFGFIGELKEGETLKIHSDDLPNRLKEIRDFPGLDLHVIASRIQSAGILILKGNETFKKIGKANALASEMYGLFYKLAVEYIYLQEEAYYSALKSLMVESIIKKGVERVKSARAGKGKAANNAATKAMSDIKQIWQKQNASKTYRGDASFSKSIHSKYPDIENEGSIKNAISRWRREQK